MKKTSAVSIASAVVIMFFFSVALNTSTVTADGDYEITHANHRLDVLYNGYVLINDTIEVSGQIADSFLLGFPNKYGPYVIRCVAYDTQDRSVTFPVNLDVPLQNRIGFYGVEIDFSTGSPQVFSVEFLLSSNLLVQDAQNATSFTLVFPGFPSLTRPAALCNVSIVLPRSAEYVGGTVEGLSYSEVSLPAFAYNESVVRFYLPDEKIQLFDVNELKRELKISESNEILGSDSYYITSKAPKTIGFVEVVLPPNASNPAVEDQFGRTMSKPTLAEINTTRYKIVFTLPVETGKPTKFTISYKLPREVYIKPLNEANSFELTVTMFQEVNYLIHQASVTFILPEGAKLLKLERAASGSSYTIERSVFQETATITEANLVSVDELSVGIAYEYNSLWSGVGPTMWVWATLIVGMVVVAVWRRPKAPVQVAVPAATAKLGPGLIRSFASSYEEKLKLVSDIDSLENRAQKGRIPRRRYKVQRKTLEARISTLSRSLEEMKEKMYSAGGHYYSLMRQLETTETEMNEVKANIKSIETRHGRGELSLEAYRKLLDEYQRHREKASATMDGILLRLREEIR